MASSNGDASPTSSSAMSPPTNSLVTPLLTDLYQITMCYAYWKSKKHLAPSVFELFFRKNPFGGEYTIFAGLDEVLRHLTNFRFTESDLTFLRSSPALSHCDPAFFDEYLAKLDCSNVQVHAMTEGSMVFPRIPLLVVTAPLGIGQLLETTLLTLVNYPSLVATNAARMVVSARGQSWEESVKLSSPLRRGSASSVDTGPVDFSRKKPKCIEFGLRRAQGPDGGFSASKYSYVGGFDATSNVLAGKILGIPIAGTHAHAFVQAHSSLEDVKGVKLKSHKAGGAEVEVLPKVLEYRRELQWTETNDGELAAFMAYAASFPDSFLCLIDTYDTLRSGLRNFILVSLVLHDLGHKPFGVRLDSGDLSYFSLEVERVFHEMAERFSRPFFRGLEIVASNDINEEVLHSLNKQGHAITVFGIGTHLVTCQAQPALGCVYKLVELDGKPRMKLSNDLEKVLIPGRKIPYRLFGEAGWPLLDLMVGADEAKQPEVGCRVLCRHPFIEQKRVAVTAQRVIKLHNLVFDRNNGLVTDDPDLAGARDFVADQIKHMRPDILRHINPGQYKVSVSDSLFNYLHDLWQEKTPVVELR